MSDFFKVLVKVILIQSLFFMPPVFADETEENEPASPSHLPMVVVQPSTPLTMNELYSRITSAIEEKKENSKKRTESEKRRLTKNLSILVKSGFLFSDFHICLLGTALSELERDFNVNEAQDDLGKSLVAQMKSIVGNTTKNGIVYDSLSSSEDLKKIDELAGSMELNHDFIELLDDTYLQAVFNLRRLLVVTGHTSEEKMSFNGKEIIDFSNLPLNVLSSRFKKRFYDLKDNFSTSDSTERRYAHLIGNELGMVVGIGSFVIGILGFFGGMVAGDAILFTSTVMGGVGGFTWAIGSSEVDNERHAKITQQAGETLVLTAAALPLIVDPLVLGNLVKLHIKRLHCTIL